LPRRVAPFRDNFFTGPYWGDESRIGIERVAEALLAPAFSIKYVIKSKNLLGRACRLRTELDYKTAAACDDILS